MKTHPYNLRTNERSETTRPLYAYVIIHGTDKFHLTNLDTSFSITGLPATHGSDPQTFSPAQVGHSPVNQQSEINAPNVNVMVGMGDNTFADALKALVLTAVPKKTTIVIARINPTSLTGLDWSSDAYVIFKGVVVNLSFQRRQISLSCVSLLMQQEGKVPRYFWQKTCQHMLYGNLCGVNPEAAANKLSTTIASVSARAKFVDIADTTINGSTIVATTFQGGYLTISGEKISILATQIIGGGGGTRLYLAWWNSALIASASIAVYRGCLRTVDACQNTFSNLANFGGMPYIPDVNPTVQGIRTGKNG